MGLPLSGFDQWDAITGRRSEDVDGPVRRDLVLGMSSYKFDPPSHSMVSLKAPRGAFISDGWKVILGDRCVSYGLRCRVAYGTRATIYVSTFVAQAFCA